MTMKRKSFYVFIQGLLYFLNINLYNLVCRQVKIMAVIKRYIMNSLWFEQLTDLTIFS